MHTCGMRKRVTATCKNSNLKYEFNICPYQNASADIILYRTLTRVTLQMWHVKKSYCHMRELQLEIWVQHLYISQCKRCWYHRAWDFNKVRGVDILFDVDRSWMHARHKCAGNSNLKYEFNICTYQNANAEYHRAWDFNKVRGVDIVRCWSFMHACRHKCAAAAW